MKKIRIGLFGLNANSNNLGCAALSYSFVGILLDIITKKDGKYLITLYDSVNSSLTDVSMFNHSNAQFEMYRYNKKNIKELLSKLKEEDIVFDFTAGDSFTDYYGLDRFVKRTFNKTLVIIAGKRLVLGPQTYGPFDSVISKVWARYVLNHTAQIYARDALSKTRAENLKIQKPVKLVTDVAFSLKYDKSLYTDIIPKNKTNIALNFSGLLYSGGYTRNNQFDLTVDYQRYCKGVMDYLSSKQEQYNIWLLPHATSKNDDFPDNDLIPVRQLSSEYNFVLQAPSFTTPMEAKSFISQMDIFSGARMHATIAAFSSGVATIPFSYSVKFEGLYDELEYQYCIHGKTDTTDEAINKTIEYIENVSILRDAQRKSLSIIDNKMASFVSNLQLLFLDLK